MGDDTSMVLCFSNVDNAKYCRELLTYLTVFDSFMRI
jgi:hypothetical protein